MMPLDSTRDFTRQRITELVKSAIIDPAVANIDATPPANLNAESYADPVRKLLPCHTKEATLISAGYYYSDPLSYGSQYQNLIQDQLEMWADRHGVYDEMNSVKNAAQGVLPLPVSGDFIPGTEIPIRDADEVKMAAWHLNEYATAYLPDDRRGIASFILSKGDNLTLTERSNMEKLAGFGYSKPEHVANEIEQQAALCRLHRHDKTAETLDQLAQAVKLASATKKASYMHGDVIQPIVSLVDTAIRSHFGKGVDETRFYQQSPAGIHDYMYNHVKLANQSVVKIADFKTAPIQPIVGIFGTKLASDLSTAGDTGRKALQGLTAKQADDLLRVTGVQPVSRSHAVKLRLSDLPVA